jgi:hypothetical protein
LFLGEPPIVICPPASGPKNSCNTPITPCLPKYLIDVFLSITEISEHDLDHHKTNSEIAKDIK